MPVSPVRAVDVIIDSAVGAPQAGQGGQFFVTTTGTISGGGNGIEAGTGGTSITMLTVQGSVNVTGYALNVADGAMMNGVINYGVMSGDRVIQTYGNTQMGPILNSGTMSATGYGVLLYGTSTGFGNTGVLTATNNDAVYLIGPTSYFGNAGTITAGGLGVYVHNQLGGGENSGTIQSGNHGMYVNGGAIVVEFLNSGTITSGAHGVQNSGTIAGMTNSGLITGVRGLQADPGSSFTTLTNSGTVRGSEYGMVLYATTETFENAAGGLIEATTSTDGIFHQGTTTTFTNDGRIAGVRYGMLNNAGGTITTLSNAGTIEGSRGLQTAGGSTIGTLSNSGTIRGTSDGISHEGGTITSLVNQVGGLIEGVGDSGIDMGSSATFGTIDNAGTITGRYGVYLPGSLTTFINRSTGVVTATSSYGFYNSNPLATFTNEAGGLIESAGDYGVYVGEDIGTFVNAGTIRTSDDAGLYVDYVVTTLTNSGTISGQYGIEKSDEIGILTNTATGLLQGTESGLYINDDADMTVVNYGRIIGGEQGIYAYYDFGPFTNKSGAIVSGTSEAGILIADDAAPGVTTITNEANALITSANGAGVRVSANGYDPGSIDNAGTIEGATGGVRIDAGGLTKITNTGTITGGTAGVWLASGNLATLSNSGTVQGTAYGMTLAGTSGTISNLAGGRIAGTSDDGVYVSGAVTSLANAGTLAGGTGTNDSGLELAGSGTIGTLTNTGVIGTTTGYYGIYTRDSSGIGSIVNSGTIQSYYYAINHEGNTITSLVNQAGGLIKSYNSNAVGGGGIGSIDNSGTIEGDSGIRHNRSPLMGTITNRSGGVIRGTYDAAIYTDRGMTSITNEAGGLIESTAWHGISLASEVPTITNAGTIRTTYSSADGIRNTYAMANLTNSGTIQGGTSGRGLYLDEVTGTVTNTATGLIEGGRYGYYVGDDTNAIVNAGQFRGGDTGIYAGYTVTSLVNQAGGVSSGTSRAGIKLEDTNGTITNQAGGRIESANGDGINVGGYGTTYVTGTIANAGTIEGGTSGVQVTNGRLQKLTNSGTLAYTGAGTGPAVLVGAGGVLGDATGASGPALVSTGEFALLDGTIVNKGTIHHGFTIENQSVTVSADGGVGTFTNGLLEVVDGNLTFTGGGTTTLVANVSVDGGSGTVFNEAVLAVIGSGSIAGNFTQTSAGTTSSIITDPATFGSLSISGAATFAGKLDLDLTGAFALAEGQLFNLFSFDSYSGDFSGLSVDGVSLTSFGANKWLYGDLVVQENWSTSGMSVSIAPVPEPSTFALGAAGIACAAWLRHRRRVAARKAA